MDALQKTIERIEDNSSSYYKYYMGKYSVIIGWKEPLTDNKKAKALRLINSVADENYLDEYFTRNPLKLYILDNAPEMKKGVLARTGIKDLSKIGRSLDKGII